jgi:two-component sensor histidine kinase
VHLPEPTTTDRLLTWAVRHRLAPGWRYLIAFSDMAGIGIVRAMYITSLLPWLPFIPAVMFLGLLLGSRVGFFSMALASVFAAISIAPGYDPRNLSVQQWWATAIFILIVGFMVFVVGKLRTIYRRNALLLASSEKAASLLIEREAELAMVNAELGHRLKNQLTVVQAIVSQILRRSETLAGAERAVSERLSALGRATDLLLQSGEHEHEIGRLLETVVAPLKVSGNRISCEGGSLRLTREASLALALAIHELATNAVKYGALSNEEGRVEITWHLGEPQMDGSTHFNFRWREVGGPAVQKPVRRGFGTALLQRALAPYFDGKISTDFRPDGVSFEIDAKVSPSKLPPPAAPAIEK